MPPFSHVIERQHVCLRLSPAADGAALQRRAEQVLLAPTLKQALGAVFDQALAAAGLPPETWLLLDRLTLDLGRLALPDLEASLQEQLPTRVASLLAATGRRLAPTPAGEAAEAARPTAQVVTAPAAAWAAWLHFLQHGALPAHWPAPVSHGQWERSLRQLLAAAPAGGLPVLRQVLAEAGARLRLLRQFSGGVVAAVLRALAPVGSAPPAAHLRQLLAAALPASHATWSAVEASVGEAAVSQLLARAAAQLLDWPALRQVRAETKTAIVPALARLTASASAVSQAAPPVPATSLPATSLPAASLPAIGLSGRPAAGQLAPEQAYEAATTTEARSQPSQRGIGQLTTAPGHLATHPTRSVAQPAVGLEAGDHPAGAAAEAQYVANAGVVLLHPFLPACFEACDWLTPAQDGFVSEAAQRAAVLLVHFLATGRRQAAEHELLLPRLLCGVPATAPSPPRWLSLSRAARAEGQALLRAAIGHWGALRGTSPAGLRQAFLQRAGKLEPATTGGPTLTVEQQAPDVLLARLPYGWSTGLVQLPWLPQHLLVNWA